MEKLGERSQTLPNWLVETTLGYVFLGLRFFVLGLLVWMGLAVFITFVYYTWNPVWMPLFNLLGYLWELGWVGFVLSLILVLVACLILTCLGYLIFCRKIKALTVPLLTGVTMLLLATCYEAFRLFPEFWAALLSTEHGSYQPHATIVVLIVITLGFGYKFAHDLGDTP